jgi:hypothetical protein
MNHIAWDLQQSHPNIKVISYNWGPWDGGMVDKNLKKLFEQRGVQIIPREDGAQIFVETALSNSRTPSPVLVIGNDIRGRDDQISLESWEESISIKLEDNSLFEDHSIGGVPVLPATFALTLLLRTVEDRYPGNQIMSFQSFRVLQGIRFEAENSDYFKIKVGSIRKTDEGTYIHVSLISSDKNKSLPNQHYSVQVKLEPALPKPTRHLDDKPWMPTNFEAYGNGTLFHKNYFKVLAPTRQSPHGSNSFEVNLPQIPRQKIRNWAGNRFSPMLLDAGLQAMLVRGRELTNLPSLPLSIDKGTFKTPLRNSNYKIKIEHEKLSGNSQLVANLVFFNETSECVLQLEGVAVTFSEKLKPLFQNKTEE